MKKHFIALSFVLALTTTSTKAGWFNKEERERRIATEHQLEHQRQATGVWQIAAGGFAVLAVIAFTAATMLGSKTRRKDNETNQ